MKRAVDPVLDEIGEDHDLDELKRDRLAGDDATERAPLRVRDELHGGPERGVGEALHHHAADEIIEEVLAPLETEEFLALVTREEELDRHEKDAGEDDVEDEPIHAEENRARAAGDFLDRLRAAECCRQHDEEERGEAEDFILAQDQAGRSTGRRPGRATLAGRCGRPADRTSRGLAGR